MRFWKDPKGAKSTGPPKTELVAVEATTRKARRAIAAMQRKKHVNRRGRNKNGRLP